MENSLKITEKDRNQIEKLLSKEHWHCLTQGTSCSQDCHLKTIFNLLGKKHTLEIIRELLLKPNLRFNQILELIPSSPKTLTSRLKDLELFSIIQRKSYNEIPPRVEYTLTEAGRGLEPIFTSLSQWIKTWKESLFSFT